MRHCESSIIRAPGQLCPKDTSDRNLVFQEGHFNLKSNSFLGHSFCRLLFQKYFQNKENSCDSNEATNYVQIMEADVDFYGKILLAPYGTCS